jgi:DNA-binding Xre family transcriptional regulator
VNRKMGYQWNLRALMADRGMFATSDLVPLLAERGVHLSREQVYRLVTAAPQRLSMDTLAALCDILGATPNDLIEVRAVNVQVAKAVGGARPAPSARCTVVRRPGPLMSPAPASRETLAQILDRVTAVAAAAVPGLDEAGARALVSEAASQRRALRHLDRHLAAFPLRPVRDEPAAACHAGPPRPGHPGPAPARLGPLRQRVQPAVGRRLAHRNARRHAPSRAGRDSPPPGTHQRPARRSAQASALHHVRDMLVQVGVLPREMSTSSGSSPGSASSSPAAPRSTPLSCAPT